MNNKLITFVTTAVENTNEQSLNDNELNKARIQKLIELNTLLCDIGAENLMNALNFSLNEYSSFSISDLTTPNIQEIIDFLGA